MERKNWLLFFVRFGTVSGEGFTESYLRNSYQGFSLIKNDKTEKILNMYNTFENFISNFSDEPDNGNNPEFPQKEIINNETVA